MTKKEQMRAMREQGMKHKEIAAAFGVSAQYVSVVCGKFGPSHFVPIGDECIYPNLRKWMNKNKVTRAEFLRRMELATHNSNHARFNKCIRGEYQPRKPFIDKMIKVTGLKYETLFYTEVDNG